MTPAEEAAEVRRESESAVSDLPPVSSTVTHSQVVSSRKRDFGALRPVE